MRLLKLFLWTGIAWSQTQTPEFEVVSIKPAPGTGMDLTCAGRVGIVETNTQASYRGIALSDFVKEAYDLPSDRVIRPDWLDQANFDIAAKIPAGGTKTQIPAMLRRMLEDRFQLAVHQEQRDLSVYFLKAGKSPKITKSTTTTPAEKGCSGAPAHRTCRGVSMEELADQLSIGYRHMVQTGGTAGRILLDRLVVDKTGIEGEYDFTMESGSAAGASGPVSRRGAASGGDGFVVTLAEAVKALGFVLEPGKAKFDYLIVDHIERVPVEH